MNVSYFKYVNDFLLSIFGQQQFGALGIDAEAATFYFGSFIYPKYMIKYLNEDTGRKLSSEERAVN